MMSAVALRPSTAAGAAAQRCDASPRRVESIARSAHPIAKPSRSAPVTVASPPSANGTATSAMAEATPASREPAMTFAEVRVVVWSDMTLLVDGDARGESQLGEEGRRGGDHDEGGEAGQHGEGAEREEGITDAVRDQAGHVEAG